jgi:hypothetical protein
MEIKRNVAFGQWKGATMVIQIGATALIWGDVPDHPTRGTRYPFLLEILTPAEWFRCRRGRWAR